VVTWPLSGAGDLPGQLAQEQEGMPGFTSFWAVLSVPGERFVP
jgi:hypothetical protein